jgi:hypothetical protein
MRKSEQILLSPDFPAESKTNGTIVLPVVLYRYETMSLLWMDGIQDTRENFPKLVGRKCF